MLLKFGVEYRAERDNRQPHIRLYMRDGHQIITSRGRDHGPGGSGFRFQYRVKHPSNQAKSRFFRADRSKMI